MLNHGNERTIKKIHLENEYLQTYNFLFFIFLFLFFCFFFFFFSLFLFSIYFIYIVNDSSMHYSIFINDEIKSYECRFGKSFYQKQYSDPC